MIPQLLEVRLPWALDCALMASAFYGFGWIARKTRVLEMLQELARKRKIVCWSIVVTLSIAMLPSVIYNGEVNMRTVTYGNYFLYILNAVVYSILLILISIGILFI